MKQMSNSISSARNEAENSTKVEAIPSAHYIRNTVLGEVRCYHIEQFPKNRESKNKLSIEQHKIRNKAVKINEKSFCCSKCGKEQPIKEFYIKDKNTGRRSKSCRDCQMQQMQVIEIGKLRFAEKILRKGFRRCSCCKNIKPITEYTKSKNSYGGLLNSCKVCNYELSRKFITKQNKEIGDFHVKQYGKLKYGYDKFSEELVNDLRNEIIKKRSPKYFVDGFSFINVTDFAKYINENYNIGLSCVEKRIAEGANEEECKIQEFEYRCLKSGTNKGKIKVTDTVTNQEFIFNSSNDIGLKKMFSTSAINRCLQTGEKTKITSLSKYKNPCLIVRV